MAEVKWIKVVTDIFDDEKIVLIEALPESDSIIVIWFKLLCLSGKLNNHGIIALANGLPYSDEMLAATFHRPLNTVRLALKTFEQFGMIAYINGNITIANWEKHQHIEGLDKIREDTRKRVAAYRERQKLQLNAGKNDKTEQCNVTSNVTVTNSNDIRSKNKEKDIRSSSGSSSIDYNVTTTTAPDNLASYAAGNIPMSPTNMQELLSFQEDLPDELIFYAIDEACANNKRNYSYVRAILNKLLQDGVKTVAEAKSRKKSTAPPEPQSFYKYNY